MIQWLRVCFHCRGLRVWSPVRELRSQMSCSEAKKKKRTQTETKMWIQWTLLKVRLKAWKKRHVSSGGLSVPTHLPTASGRQAGTGCGLPASLTAGLTQTWQHAEKAGSFKSGKLWPPHLDSWMETSGGVCLQRQCQGRFSKGHF